MHNSVRYHLFGRFAALLFATYQLFRGSNIHQLAIQMGTNVSMLEKHYSKLTPMLLADEFAGIRHKGKVIWG